MADAFISYARADGEFATQLLERLRQKGLTVAFDQEVIVGGQQLDSRVEHEIQAAKVVVLLLSRHARRSRWVQQELITALESGASRSIVPVLLDDEAEANVVWPLVADREAIRVGDISGSLEVIADRVASVVQGSPSRALTRRKLALVGAGVFILAASAAMLGRELEARKIRYSISVLDSLRDVGVPAATILLRVQDAHFIGETDSVGKFTFSLPEHYAGKPATLRVLKPGYRPSDLESTLADGGLSFRLYPEAAPSGTSSSAIPTPQSSGSAGTRVTETLAFSSGPKVSGERKNFSEWYELCSTPLPKGANVESVTFVLSGDRSCGAWAECREKERSDRQVCWEFRMQGHDEWFPPGQAVSEGNLRVTISRPN